MYVSEQRNFRDFRNPDALFWKQMDLVYGEWTGGVNNDGMYEKKGQIPISQVSTGLNYLKKKYV